MKTDTYYLKLDIDTDVYDGYNIWKILIDNDNITESCIYSNRGMSSFGVGVIPLDKEDSVTHWLDSWGYYTVKGKGMWLLTEEEAFLEMI